MFKENKINKIHQQYKIFVLYGIIGGFSAGLDFITYTLLTKFLGIDYMIVNVISVHIGIFTSFLLNSQYNFKVKDRRFIRFLSFYAIGLTGLFVSSSLLYFLVEKISLNPVISKLVTLVVVVIVQFSLNKYITFKTKKY